MRTCDVPYVRNPALPTFHVPYDEMTLQELTKTYIRTCGKSNGLLSECRKCETKCQYGIRALQLFENKVDVNEDKDNRTLTILERKRAMEQTASKQEQPASVKKSNKKQGRNQHQKKQLEESIILIEAAFRSEDPVAYIMNKIGFTEKQAKSKIANFKHLHTEEMERIIDKIRKEKSAQIIMNAETNIGPKEPAHENLDVKQEEQAKSADKDALLAPLESKINDLMNQQAEYKKQYEYYLGLYNGIKTKVDALYEALDILNN